MTALTMFAFAGVGVAAWLWGRSWLRSRRLGRRPVVTVAELDKVEDGTPVVVEGRTAGDEGLVGPWSRLPCVWHEEIVRRGYPAGPGHEDWRTDLERAAGDAAIHRDGGRAAVDVGLGRRGLFALREPMMTRSYLDDGREANGERRAYSITEYIVRPDIGTVVAGTLLREPGGEFRIVRGSWVDGTAEGTAGEIRGRHRAYRRRLTVVGGVFLLVAVGLLLL